MWLELCGSRNEEKGRGRDHSSLVSWFFLWDVIKSKRGGAQK